LRPIIALVVDIFAESKRAVDYCKLFRLHHFQFVFVVSKSPNEMDEKERVYRERYKESL